jgi:hypothetical protein
MGYLFEHIQACHDFAKHHVLAIQMWRGLERDEKLRAIPGVWVGCMSHSRNKQQPGAGEGGRWCSYVFLPALAMESMPAAVCFFTKFSSVAAEGTGSERMESILQIMKSGVAVVAIPANFAP